MGRQAAVPLNQLPESGSNSSWPRLAETRGPNTTARLSARVRVSERRDHGTYRFPQCLSAKSRYAVQSNSVTSCFPARMW